MSGTAARIAEIKSETAIGVAETVKCSSEFIKLEGLTSEQQAAIRQNTLRNIIAFTKSQEAEITRILQEETKKREGSLRALCFISKISRLMSNSKAIC